MLLFITSEIYQSFVDALIAECDHRGVSYLRLYTEQFPSEVVLTIQPERGRPQGSIYTPEGETPLEAISAVWHYLPGQSRVDPGVDEVARMLIQQEAGETLDGLARGLEDRRWINLPHAIYAAQHKLFQLRLAAQAGFKTPKSLLTNQPEQARRFLQVCGGRMVYKPRQPFLQFNADGYPTNGVFVTLVTQPDLDSYVDSVAVAPCLFQELVPKRQEVTVYVIGSYVFAAAVRGPDDASSLAIDHRIYGLENCRYTPVLLPHSVEQSCLAMTRRLNLGMCNFDLIRTPDDNYVFLDANPTEQWTFVEQVTGFPLSAAIMDELLGEKTITVHPYLRHRSLNFPPLGVARSRKENAR